MKRQANMKDIEDLEALMGKIATVKQHALEQNQLPVYTINIKKETVRLKFLFGIRSEAMDSELGFPNGETASWTIKYKTKKNAVSQLHGSTCRYDIPTKCLIVKMHIEDGIPGHKLADEYGVSQGTVSHWKKQYKKNYNDLIHAPEGMMIIGKEEKRVIGLTNIKKVQAVAAKAEQVVKEVMNTYGTFSDEAPADAAVDKMDELANSFIQK